MLFNCEFVGPAKVFLHLIRLDILDSLNVKLDKVGVDYPLKVVRAKVHDRIAALVDSLATISKVLTVCAVLSGSRDRSALQSFRREHLLVGDDGGPGRGSLELDEVVVTGLGLEM